MERLKSGLSGFTAKAVPTVNKIEQVAISKIFFIVFPLGFDYFKVHIACHNLELLRLLLPSKISTGNVNLNKKKPLAWRGFIVDIFIIQEWFTTLGS